MTTRRQLLTALAAFTASTTAWVGGLSTVLGPREGTLAGDPDDPVIRGLLERHLALWEGGSHGDLLAMRATNPEWDFMGRSFLGLALLEVAMRRPGEAPRMIAALDAMLHDTIGAQDRFGPLHWLLPYARSAPFRNREGRSLFVDGELLAVLAARRLVMRHLDLPGADRFSDRQADFAAHVSTHLDESPLGHGESYPDECWAFCNAFAAAGLVLDTRTSGRDHTARLDRYLRTLKSTLVDPVTGLAISEYTFGGGPQDGPEGSSIFLTSAHLQLADPAFARVQYETARSHLVRDLAGFGWAREWPDTWRGVMDVDSGPIIPLLDASAGSSGLAFVGAGAFGDRDTLSALLASLELAAFPTWEGDELHFAASNQVGDAVLLYALVQGPLKRLATNGDPA
ncbi:MAG: hypothetical protein R3F61_08025 [Myxococcota bacterium]